MADEKDMRQAEEPADVVELDDESLAGVSGGGLRDKVYITPTTDISDDTRDKIAGSPRII